MSIARRRREVWKARVSGVVWLASLALLTACVPDTRAAASLLPTAEPPLLPTRTPVGASTPLPTIAPGPTFIAPTLRPTPTPLPTFSATTAAAGWRAVRSGVEVRELYKDHTARTGRVHVVRIDPAHVDFHVRYQPDTPLRVSEWYSDSQALVVVNSSFFDQARRAVGNLTSDGVSAGQAHERMQGAFYLTAVGATVWPLQGWIKPAGLHVIEAVESFPMLLLPGGLLNPDISDDARAARRTAVGVDRAGRVLFIGVPENTFTLYGLAVWLANSDLDLDTALNLDGGSSSGLAVWTPQGRWGFDSTKQVPVVITVENKVTGTLGSGGGEWP